MNQEECLALFIEIILAFKIIHDSTLIHKTVRAENFLIDGLGHLKVAGFNNFA